MATFELDRLVLEKEGDSSEVVVCIHGLGGSTNTWTPVLPAFHGKTVIRVDLPGSARSAMPATPVSIASFVTDILSVFEHFDVQSAHVVAHSMGTIIAQHLAVDYPDRVRSLALFGPLAAPADPARGATLTRAALARTGFAGMQEIADAISKSAVSTETKERHPTTVTLIRESLMRQLPEGYARTCEALAAAQAALVEKLTIPVLLMTGQEDGVATPAATQLLSNRMSHSQTKLIQGCGHWPTYEKPFECRDALGAFYTN